LTVGSGRALALEKLYLALKTYVDYSDAPGWDIHAADKLWDELLGAMKGVEESNHDETPHSPT
jgi:hypothetical protein